MTSVQKNGEQIAAYAYDHQSQRVKKTLYAGGPPTSTIWFLYGQEGLLAEYDGTGSTLEKKFAWQPDHPWGTSLLRRSSVTLTMYFINDHLASPQKCIDSSFTTYWQGDWSVFGRIAESGLLDQFWVFPGQYYDSECSIVQNMYRSYSCATGRYFSVDPVRRYLSGNYNYSANNPIRFFDNRGLDPSESCKGLFDSYQVSTVLVDFFNHPDRCTGNDNCGWFIQRKCSEGVSSFADNLFPFSDWMKKSCPPNSVILWIAKFGNTNVEYPKGYTDWIYSNYAWLYEKCRQERGEPHGETWALGQSSQFAGSSLVGGNGSSSYHTIVWCCKCEKK